MNNDLNPHGYLNIYNAWSNHDEVMIPVRIADLRRWAKEIDDLCLRNHTLETEQMQTIQQEINDGRKSS